MRAMSPSMASISRTALVETFSVADHEDMALHHLLQTVLKGFTERGSSFGSINRAGDCFSSSSTLVLGNQTLFARLRA